MSPGSNWFQRSSFLPSRFRHECYTSWIPSPLIHTLDCHLMFTTPRDAAVPRLRWDLVVRVRREIEAGTYDTPEKWAIALARLQDDLEQDSYDPDQQPAQ